MFKKILIPLDGSDLAEQALEPASRLVEPFSGQLILMCLASRQTFSAETADDAAAPLAPDEAEAYLHQIEQQTRQFNCTVQTKRMDKMDAAAIVETAAAEAVDLVVMADQGTSGLKGWLLGNPTELVIHQAPCPVLVVRSAAPWSKVAVALNGEEWAEAILPLATHIAQNTTASLTLLHILEDIADLENMQLGELEGLGSVPTNPERDVQARAEGLAYLQQVSAQLPSLSESVQMELLTGSAVPSLRRYVETEQVDLVALSTHNRSGWQRWVHRSTVDEFLRGTDIALLVVPIADESIA
ncbi:MAG: universal stress protein [Anaerolineae bacterium]|nr:universal stress protein [Anaerolineae bacterium]